MFVLLFVFLLLLRTTLKYRYVNCESKRRLDGRTCVVTGGTSGMGLETARELARRGARVIIACPFPQEGRDARAAIVRDTNNQNVVFKHLDLSSLQSTRDFAHKILQSEERLDILINNAGVGNARKITQDGLPYTMQVNYYGHFLLTNILLPLLKKSGTPDDKSRIVNVSSMLYCIGRYKHGSMNKPDRWDDWLTYSDSKLCILLFALALTERLKGCNVIVNSVDPGAVGTGIFVWTWGIVAGWFLRRFFSFFCKNPWQGAQSTIYAAIDENVSNVSSKLIRNCKIVDVWKFASDPIAAEQLWDESLKCPGSCLTWWGAAGTMTKCMNKIYGY